MIQVVNKYKFDPSDKISFYIGRGSALGNPFTSIKDKITKAQYVCDSREESVSNYESYLIEKIKVKDKSICDALNEIYLKAKCGDVYLVCFCAPKSCHGDIIKKIVDEKLFGFKRKTD